MILLTKLSATETLLNTLSNLLFWGALIAAVAIISLGFLVQKKQWIFKDWEKVLVKIVVFFGLPSLIIKSFMTGINIDSLKNMSVILVLGLLFYTIMSFGSKLFFLKTKKSIQDTLSMCVAFASNIYFGLPIIKALYGGDPLVAIEIDQAANMFNVGYWIFMCSYAVYIIRRKSSDTAVAVSSDEMKAVEGTIVKEASSSGKFTKKDFISLIKNPIILATIFGIFIWITQLIPGINIISPEKWNASGDKITDKYSPLRFDLIIPGFNKVLVSLSALATPLAWLSIGCVIAKGDIKKAIKSKLVWYTFVLKNIVSPLIVLVMTIAFAAIGDATGTFEISGVSLQLIVLMIAAPTANTIVGYAIAYQKEEELASNVATLTTLGGIVTIPLFALIAGATASLSMFK